MKLTYVYKAVFELRDHPTPASPVLVLGLKKGLCHHSQQVSIFNELMESYWRIDYFSHIGDVY